MASNPYVQKTVKEVVVTYSSIINNDGELIKSDPKTKRFNKLSLSRIKAQELLHKEYPDVTIMIESIVASRTTYRMLIKDFITQAEIVSSIEITN